MKCDNCGFENADTNAFCINCGNSLKEQQPVASEPALSSEPTPTISVNPVAEKVIWVLKDNLFLAICILTSVLTGTSLLSGSLNVIGVLFTIFLWLIFAKTKKNLVDVANMRRVSGTIFANYVIGWVAFGCIAFLTVIIIAIGGAGSLYLDEILAKLDLGSLYNGLASLTAGIFVFGLLVFAMIIILAAILVSIFAFCTIHKFAKSLYVSVLTGVFNLEKVDAAKNWLLALGIIEGISALSSISNIWAFLATGCSAAIYFIAYALIKKHFKPITVQ